MKIIILGSGTCVPSLKRKPSSVLLQAMGKNILIDIGPGIIGQLLRAGLTIDRIDMICLSHFHIDHCADLAPYIFATKYPVLKRTKGLKLVGGEGVKSYFCQLNEVYQNHLQMPGDLFEIIELSEHGSQKIFKGLDLKWIKTVHKPESRAFRFEDQNGYSFVYTGDTDVCNALPAFSQNADLLVCESAMPDEEKVAGHLTPGLAGEMAQKAGVHNLILTHFYPECENADIMSQCREKFKGNILLAKDLLAF